MFAHLRSLKPDLVQFNAPNFWAAAMLQLARYNGPLVVTHHADVFGRRFLKRATMPIYHRLLRHATCIVLNSLKNAATSTDIPAGVGPLVAIPHGINASLYELDSRDREDTEDERRRLFGDAPVLGFIGRFVRYKGLSVLVDALARLNGVHALMIGDGPLRRQTEEQARIAGVAERMHFLGNVDETTKIRSLAMMDVLLLPSIETTEAFGLAQIEAQFMEVPVVASNLPTGVTDVTIDGETGLLVPPGDPEALANAVSRIVDSPDLAARFGRSGRAHALRHFTFDLFQQRYEELLEMMLNHRSIEGPIKPFASSPRFDYRARSDGRVEPLPDVQSAE
jgi:rhamnosyl/mannosyltransferase